MLNSLLGVLREEIRENEATSLRGDTNPMSMSCGVGAVIAEVWQLEERISSWLKGLLEKI